MFSSRYPTQSPTMTWAGHCEWFVQFDARGPIQESFGTSIFMILESLLLF